MIDQPAGPKQPVDRTVGCQRPSEGRVVVHQFGQPVRPLDGVVKAQHVRERPRPGPGRRIRLAECPLRQPECIVGHSQPGIGDGKPDPQRCSGKVRQGFAEVHVAQCMGVASARPVLLRRA